MTILSRLIPIAVMGALAVALLSLAVNVISISAPAKPALYFILWALALIPAVLLAIGALAARASYFACRGPNESVVASIATAVVSAVAGIVLGWFAGRSFGVTGAIDEYLRALPPGSYQDLSFLLVVYALAGAIGGIVDYYLSRGRRCDINKRG
jgi:uncharacterized membrane protein